MNGSRRVRFRDKSSGRTVSVEIRPDMNAPDVTEAVRRAAGVSNPIALYYRNHNGEERALQLRSGRDVLELADMGTTLMFDTSRLYGWFR